MARYTENPPLVLGHNSPTPIATPIKPLLPVQKSLEGDGGGHASSGSDDLSEDQRAMKTPVVKK